MAQRLVKFEAHTAVHLLQLIEYALGSAQSEMPNSAHIWRLSGGNVRKSPGLSKINYKIKRIQVVRSGTATLF